MLRPLRDAASRRLCNSWHALRVRELGPPPMSRARRDGVTVTEQRAIKAQEDAFLRRPDAALLTGAIECLELTHIKRVVKLLASRWRCIMTYDEALTEAHTLFQGILFRFDQDGPATLGGFLHRGFEMFFLKDNRSLKRSVQTVRARGECADDDSPRTPERSAADHGEHSPTDSAQNAEAIRALRKALARLTDRQRQVVMLRYGLASDGKQHTLQETADMTGVSRQAVKIIEERALARCRQVLPRGLSDDGHDR